MIIIFFFKRSSHRRLSST